MLLDATRDVLRICHKSMDPVAGKDVPSPESGGEELHRGPGKNSGFATSKIVVVHLPDIAHRCVTITNMESPRSGHGSFRHTVARREDEIVGREVERFDGTGKERKVAPVVRFFKGEGIDKRRPDVHPFNHGRNGPRVV